jgi:hypothetical protein
LDQVEKVKLAKRFEVFLKTLAAAQERTSDAPEATNIKVEGSDQSKMKTGRSVFGAAIY